MTKADIVNEVAKATGIEKIAVQNVIESFMESVKIHWHRTIMCICVVLVALL